MKPPGEDPNDVIAAALARGVSQNKAAEAGGVHRSTVQRLLRTAEFVARVDEFRREYVQRTIGMMAEALPDAAALFGLAVNSDEPMAVRLKAAKELLDGFLKYRASDEFERRLAKIEERLGEPDGPTEPGGAAE
jgi:hypothetical protein